MKKSASKEKETLDKLVESRETYRSPKERGPQRPGRASEGKLCSDSPIERANQLLFPLCAQKKKIRCLNPEHQDRHPSAILYPNGFHCFACGFGGDALYYYQLSNNLSSVRAALSALGLDAPETVPIKRANREPAPIPKDLANLLLARKKLTLEVAIAEWLAEHPPEFIGYWCVRGAPTFRAHGMDPLFIYDLAQGMA